jgi:hypothetical protein
MLVFCVVGVRERLLVGVGVFGVASDFEFVEGSHLPLAR